MTTANGAKRALYLHKTGLLNVEEFANELGLAPSDNSPVGWRRRVPFVRVGRSIRFRREVVDEILRAGEVPVLEER